MTVHHPLEQIQKQSRVHAFQAFGPCAAARRRRHLALAQRALRLAQQRAQLLHILHSIHIHVQQRALRQALPQRRQHVVSGAIRLAAQQLCREGRGLIQGRSHWQGARAHVRACMQHASRAAQPCSPSAIAGWLPTPPARTRRAVGKQHLHRRQALAGNRPHCRRIVVSVLWGIQQPKAAVPAAAEFKHAAEPDRHAGWVLSSRGCGAQGES